jgi:hypothetical protein
MSREKRKFSFKKALKYILFSISAAVYIIFMARLFESCDPKIADRVYLDAQTAELFEDLTTEFPVYHCQPVSWTSEDGSIIIENIFYLEPVNKLQLTVRHRNDIYTADGEDYPFSFRVRVEGEDEFELETEPEFETDSKSKYTWARLMADGITVDKGETVEVELETFDEHGNSVVTTETEIKGGTSVYLDIYDLSGVRLYTFELAGKNVDWARIRRNKIDVVVAD